MVKIFGGALLIFAMSMVGFSKAEKIKQRYNQLITFRKILIMIQGEIRYNNSTISEALSHVAAHNDGVFKGILENTSVQVNKNTGQSFEQIWSENIGENENKLELNKEDVRIIKEFGKCMGYLDYEMQNKSIDYLISQLQLVIDELNEKMPESIKICRIMGVLAGIFVLILVV